MTVEEKTLRLLEVHVSKIHAWIKLGWIKSEDQEKIRELAKSSVQKLQAHIKDNYDLKK